MANSPAATPAANPAANPAATPASPADRKVSVVLFDGFELLDVFGPLELLGARRDQFAISLVGPGGSGGSGGLGGLGGLGGSVSSAQGPRVLADVSYDDVPSPDVVLVPGGMGTRRLVEDRAFLDWLDEWASRARLVCSVCTGSGVLAAAGLLDGYRATSNKRALAWAMSQGPAVDWVPQARWVEDRDRWTSAGVAAGMDMTVALIGSLIGQEMAADAAAQVEYEPHTDPSWDPFAARNGLV